MTYQQLLGELFMVEYRGLDRTVHRYVHIYQVEGPIDNKVLDYCALNQVSGVA